MADKKSTEEEEAPVSAAMRQAMAADRVMREVQDFRQDASVKGEEANLDRAMEMHVKPNEGFIRKYADMAGIDPKLLMAVIAVEQRGNTTPGKYVSSDKGAKGIAQVRSLVQKAYKINPDNVEDSIRGAAEYLRDMKKKFGEDYPVLGVAYHSGETNLRGHSQQPSPFGPKAREYAALMSIMQEKLNRGENTARFFETVNPTEKLRQSIPSKE